MRGFTLIEIIIVVFIVSVLAVFAIAAFRSFQQNISLDGGAAKLVSALRLAQNQTISSVEASSYGVHLDTDKYIIFSGPSYDPTAPGNQSFFLPTGLEIYNIDISGGGADVFFDRLTGRTKAGSFSLRVVLAHSKTKTIYITPSGQISFTAPLVSTGGRIIDSRHMHFNYSRVINTSLENIILTFANPPGAPVSQNIPINSNLDGNGQIYWKGIVPVGGQNQNIEILTHQLNNPDTIFSVQRNRENNTKGLSIFLSGDSANSLLQYAADGTTTPGTSVYVSGLQAQ